MRVVVVGGSGRTGALVVSLLVEAGDSVVATIRNPRHMADLVRQGAEVVMLDLDASPLADIEHAFAGADAVVFAAGSAEADPSSALDRKGVKRTLLAATKAGVPRYIAISSLGASTATPKNYDWAGAKQYFAAKRAANGYVRDSGLAWTIIEPGTLTDGPGKGKVALTEGIDIDDGKIARADVAATVAAALRVPQSAGHTFQIVAGTTPIAMAVAKASGAPAPAEPARKAARKAAKAPAEPATTKASARKPTAKPATKKTAKTPARKTRRS